MPDFISDFARGVPLPASALDATRDEGPLYEILTERQRLAVGEFAATIFPDRQVTKRMWRHIVATPTGHRYAVFKTLDECLHYCEAMELAPVGLFVCGRAILASAPLTPSPPSDANQLALFDDTPRDAS